jgi:3-deoxy-D-manno-octulosonic-acid transferase
LFNKIIEKAAFSLYGLAWGLGIPLLRLNRRLAEGYDQRCFRPPLPARAEVWIQAASVGESFLAWELLKRLKPGRPVNILVTTNTSQGMDILENAIQEIELHDRNFSVAAAYFPFDKPGIMKQAVAHLSPRVMILLESEMWPAHLAALKQAGSAILIINGRMTAKSLKGYLYWPSFWHRLKPDKILAISSRDAQRFSRLFGPKGVEIMSNIKFDRLDLHPKSSANTNLLSSLVVPDTQLIVFGSVRHQEENQVQKILLEIMRQHPTVTTALFPRHFHRLDAWISYLHVHKIRWCLRSKIDQPVSPGTVIIWDTYGELTHAYQLAVAAFVGGSLAPLGGQNFLEALTSGIRPVIGPSWEDFHWVGTEIIERGLVRVAQDWKEVVDILVKDLTQPAQPETVRKAAYRYVNNRQGGSAMACRTIAEFLD